ncbi:hypothetical protein ACFP3Q_04480 [Nocardioides sp. GCM10027113]|uniref:hypothetical protein n=1 Tax=unclassified Nocardioides TaxID=2615069 RepID=UPI00360D6754
MSGQSEEEAWRAIVENYGERPEVDPLPQEPEPAPEPFAAYVEGPVDRADEDRYVPPPPPPLPHPPPARLAAWSGLFGSPAVLLVALVLDVQLPSLVGYLLVGAFIGGFLYLVANMERGPRDPGDDGAVV